jgi:hypothetical protein
VLLLFFSVCAKVVDLFEIEGNTYNGMTNGAMNDYNVSCGGNGEEQIFKHTVRPGATIVIKQERNFFDSVHELRVGSECPGENIVKCVNDPVNKLLFFVLSFLIYMSKVFRTCCFHDLQLNFKCKI